jgi:transcriptional regulator with XRE-family HTH domain
MSASASFIVYDRPAVYPASMQENARIGARVKTVRTDHGLTQAEFGKKLAVTRGAVGNWERGEGIKRENLQAIAETFEVSFDWLATGSSSTLGAPVSVAEAGLPKFAGFVQAGGWLAVDEYFNQDRYEVPEFVLRQPQYTKVRQYAYLVRGDSVDLAGIHDGEWIVAADAATIGTATSCTPNRATRRISLSWCRTTRPPTMRRKSRSWAWFLRLSKTSTLGRLSAPESPQSRCNSKRL